MFGGFTEGLQLFASFAMLMNFPRFNKMKGMGQIVTWSVRDESLHCEGITQLFHAFVKERDCLTPAVKKDIRDVCHHTVELEDAFIDLAFEEGPVPGMTAQGDQEVHPLHRRLAPQPARPEADVHDRRPPPALARAAAERRRARQLLRDPRHRKFQGRDPRELERSLGQFRPAEGAKAANDVPAAEGDEDMFQRAGVAAEKRPTSPSTKTISCGYEGNGAPSDR